MALWLYLYLPRLQLDSLYAGNSAEQPVVVVDGRDNALVQLNDAAAALGLKAGMGLATAASLCRHLQLVEYRPEQEAVRLRELAQWLYQVTADIALDNSDGLWLKVSPMLTLYGGLDNYWQVLSDRLAPLALRYHYATGYSPLAARILARMGADCLLDDSDALRARWSACRVNRVGLPEDSAEKLQRVGVHRVEDLLAIPLKDMARRFPAQVVQSIGRLTGQLTHPLDFYRPAGHFAHYLELLYEIETVAVLQPPLARLFELLEQFLRLRDQVTPEVSLRLYLRDSEPLQVRVGAAQGEYRAAHWLKLASLTLEPLLLTAPVYALSLSAERAVPRRATDGDLFAGRRGQLSAAELVAILQAKLGRDRVTGIALNDDHRPELAACDTRVAEAGRLHTRPHKLRPLFLLDRPQRLDEAVDLLRGPERITTGWWDGRPITRDYYIARTQKGGRWYWVFRELQTAQDSRQWFLHGYFS